MALLVTLREKSVKTITHILIWSAFFVLLFLFMPFYDIQIIKIPSLFLGMFVLLIAYYYFNSQVLVPHLLAKGRFFSFIGITLLILIMYTYLSDAYGWLLPPDRMISSEGLSPSEFPPMHPDLDLREQERHLMNKHNNPGEIFKSPRFRFPFSSVLTFLLVFIVSTGTQVITSWFETERKRSMAEREKSQAELSALKSQINPHFLFNTLNNLYHMAMQKSDDTPETILKLADLMRFVLTETKTDFIPLNKEVECINQYIHLQRLRLTEKTTVSFLIDGDIDFYEIAPLLLLPFVENAFKYGVSTHFPSKIAISLVVKEDTLLFNVENRKITAVGEIETTGLGLQNVKRRLELIYPNKHKLEIKDEKENYLINLEINLA